MICRLRLRLTFRKAFLCRFSFDFCFGETRTFPFEHVERAIANALHEIVTCTFKDILSHLLIRPGMKFERQCVTIQQRRHYSQQSTYTTVVSSGRTFVRRRSLSGVHCLKSNIK